MGVVLGASSGQWELLCAPSQLFSHRMFCNVHSFAPVEPCLSQGLAHMLLLWGERRSICLTVRETGGQVTCPEAWGPLACNWSGIMRAVPKNAGAADRSHLLVRRA